MKISIQNPSIRVRSILSALPEGSVTKEWVQTCRSNTCCCASHDPGYDDWTVEGSPALIGYLESRLKRRPGNVHCHGSYGWVEFSRPALEGGVRNESAAAAARSVLSEAAAARREGVKVTAHDVELACRYAAGVTGRFGWAGGESHTEGLAALGRIQGAAQEAREISRSRKEVEFNRHFLRSRDGVIPRQGKGWTLVS